MTFFGPSPIIHPSPGGLGANIWNSFFSLSYNFDGDLIFSASKDLKINVWRSSNGERLGTYNGHVGAIWTVDIDPTTTLLASGSADNTIKLWDVATGKCLKTWEFPTAVKRVEFSEDGSRLLGVTEKRMGYLSNIVVLDIKIDVHAEQSDERAMTIVCDKSKATVAGWSYLSKYIIAGHEDGSVSQFDAIVSAYTLHPQTTIALDRRRECMTQADLTRKSRAI